MNKSDLLKEIRQKRSGILEINFRKKIDIKNLDFHVRGVIDCLEAYMHSSAAKDAASINKILGTVTNLKDYSVQLKRTDRKLKDEKRQQFDESKSMSISTIDDLLLTL